MGACIDSTCILVLFQEGVTGASFSGDGQCVLASTMDSTLRLMDKDTGELLSQYTGHTSKDYKVSDLRYYEDRSACCW